MATQNPKSPKIQVAARKAAPGEQTVGEWIKDVAPEGSNANPEVAAGIDTLLEKYNAPGKKIQLPAETDRVIGSKFKFFIGTAMNLNETMWPGFVRDHIQAIVDLVGLSKKAQLKPAELRRMKVYQVAVDSLRQLFENSMLIHLGEDYDFAFALERGFAELMERECNIIHDRGPIRCKVRFVKAKIETGDYPVYERICIRFDGQYDIQLIDRSRYGL